MGWGLLFFSFTIATEEHWALLEVCRNCLKTRKVYYIIIYFVYSPKADLIQLQSLSVDCGHRNSLLGIIVQVVPFGLCVVQ